MITKLIFLVANWKMVIHLLFQTYHFGVNNEWWSRHRSVFGAPWRERFHLIRNYRMMRFRACACHFIGPSEQLALFPSHSDYREKR